MTRALRIGVVAGRFPTVSETFVLDHVQGLLERGHDVRVLAGRPASNDRALPEDVTRTVQERVTYRANSDSTVEEKARHFGSIVSAVARRPLMLAHLTTVHSGGPESRLRLAAYVGGIAALGEVDIVHAHFGPIGAMVVDATATLGKSTPVVTTFHGYDLSGYLKSHRGNPYRRLFASGSHFLPVSDHFRTRLLELGAPNDKITVHYMGIDTERLRPSESLSDRGSLSVLMVGRMVEKKGFDYGLQAIAQARDAGVQIRATIVGDGDLRSDLERTARSLGIWEIVDFCGRQGRDYVMGALDDADVLLAPSVEASDGDIEGIPVVIMEAMAMGRAVVATHHSGIPETVLDGTTGILAPERDVRALSRALTRLAASPTLRQQMGNQGRLHVKRQHDIERGLDRLEALYARVIDLYDE